MSGLRGAATLRICPKIQVPGEQTVTISGLALFAVIYLVFVALPGPGITMLIARSLSRGLQGLFWVVCGYVLGDLILMTFAVCGLAVVAHSFSDVFLAVRYAGAAYLFWMAWKLWRTPVQKLDLPNRPGDQGAWGAFFFSFSVTLSNPKAILFFLSIMPLVIHVNRIDASSYSAIALTMIVIIGPVTALWAVLADRARRLFRSERALGRVNKGSSALMAGAAVAVLVK